MGALPGNNNNPKGRPVGSRNRRTQDMLDLLDQRGDTDPIDYLSSVVSSKNGQYTTDQKTQAANYLLPYKHSRLGLTPVPRYITDPIQLPHPAPTSLEQVNANINFVSIAQAEGRIELDFANSLLTGYRVIASNLIAEEELKIKSLNAGAASLDTTIRIEGGLPALPGCNITMPIIANGHEIDGALLTSPGEASSDEPSVTPVTTDPSTAPIDPSPSDPSKEQP